MKSRHPIAKGKWKTEKHEMAFRKVKEHIIDVANPVLSFCILFFLLQHWGGMDIDSSGSRIDKFNIKLTRPVHRYFFFFFSPRLCCEKNSFSLTAPPFICSFT